MILMQYIKAKRTKIVHKNLIQGFIRPEGLKHKSGTLLHPIIFEVNFKRNIHLHNVRNSVKFWKDLDF